MTRGHPRPLLDHIRLCFLTLLHRLAHHFGISIDNLRKPALIWFISLFALDSLPCLSSSCIRDFSSLFPSTDCDMHATVACIQLYRFLLTVLCFIVLYPHLTFLSKQQRFCLPPSLIRGELRAYCTRAGPISPLSNYKVES